MFIPWMLVAKHMRQNMHWFIGDTIYIRLDISICNIIYLQFDMDERTVIMNLQTVRGE